MIVKNILYPLKWQSTSTVTTNKLIHTCNLNSLPSEIYIFVAIYLSLLQQQCCRLEMRTDEWEAKHSYEKNEKQIFLNQKSNWSFPSKNPDT